jgi:ParB-like chromosome segregation protein Spo0J
MSRRKIVKAVREALAGLSELPLPDQVAALNEIRALIGASSPFQEEPVDVVQWVPAECVFANDYNPNSVAPAEMRLLELSILEDGYTQPIVVYQESGECFVVVDGFHRNRVGKESEQVRARINGFLPVVVIDKPLRERIASTIRHNRARGTHAIEPMAQVVERLYLLGYSYKKIAEQLGMERDEVLRLKQFTGLGSLFKGRKFSEAWE